MRKTRYHPLFPGRQLIVGAVHTLGVTGDLDHERVLIGTRDLASQTDVALGRDDRDGELLEIRVPMECRIDLERHIGIVYLFASQVGRCRSFTAPCNGREQHTAEQGAAQRVWARYWKDEALTAERVRDGWVHTRDMGYFDEDGYLYVVDRKDDVIISGGFNVWPAEIETVICRYKDVAETAVFGLADEKWGEAVIAVVVPRQGSVLNEAGLRTFLADKLTRYKIPNRIIIRDEPIPKSPVHKPLRRKLRDPYAPAGDESR